VLGSALKGARTRFITRRPRTRGSDRRGCRNERLSRHAVPHAELVCLDQFGQVIDVLLSPRRDAKAARRFLERAIGRTRISPTEVTTDRYRVYPRVLDELLPATFHDTEVHGNNLIESDHGRLKARLRPMRGLKRDRTARVIVAGHAFVQNLRRGFYDLGTEVPSSLRVADAFAEVALAI